MSDESSYHGISGRSLLAGKVAAITGASRGIGRAIALAFAAQGGSGIAIHYLGDAETTREAKAIVCEIEKLGAKAITVAGDISKQETSHNFIREAVKAFGRLDVFVSNAGVCGWSSFLDISPELWKNVQQINLDGCFYATQEAGRQMKEQKPQGGTIIAISSISALVGGSMQSHYTPTKAGIKSMIESASLSLAPYGIRANCVLPGTIATAINEDDLANTEKRRYMEQRTPLGRLGNPGDIAGAAVFLASDLSRFMTGASVLVDGGAFVNLQ